MDSIWRLQLHTTIPPWRQSFQRTAGFSSSARRSATSRGSRFRLIERWAQRPTFYVEVFGVSLACGAFYVYNLEIIPISGRSRFNVVSPDWEKELGKQQYDEIMKQFREAILPEYTSEVRAVKRVLKNLVSGLAKLESYDEFGEEGRVVNATDGSLEGWEVHVISSDEANAFVLPG
jgi:metalloendopeptidase OMA1, mitochondrial